MSKAKHTKGPWKARFKKAKENYAPSFLIETPTATICEVLLSNPNHHKDADLIAAAPEMYEALEEVLNYWTPGEAHYEGQDFFDAIGHLQALLKKARGEL